MKQTDGVFHKVFKEMAPEYPEIQTEHWIVDIGAAKLADTPELFDVIVMPNLYGDILSDVAAQITGSVGLAGSANIGEECAMFEAIHGSAPDIAGMDKANPSGLIQASVMMLNHIGQAEVAQKIQNAWLKTIEEGIHTPDIYNETSSSQKVGTHDFAQAVIRNLGKVPTRIKPAEPASSLVMQLPKYKRKPKAQKVLIGSDIFVHWDGYQASELADKLRNIECDGVKLTMITNRGIMVWPSGFEETFCTDHWRCRFMKEDSLPVDRSTIVDLLGRAISENIDVIKTENLYTFDGKPAFSLGQGQ
jgi:isocitrate dehydrogenase